MSEWKCPFCGSTHDGDSPFEDASEPSWPEGQPAPHELYAQTGWGEPYRRAMIKHGYVIVNADVRCGVPNGREERCPQ
jgi:hypothetical protein